MDLAWLSRRAGDKQLRQNVFFTHEKTQLFIPNRAALKLLDRAEVIEHRDTLYEMDQVVYGDKTLSYIVRPLCPFVAVYDNLLVFNARKTIDTSVKHKVFVQSTLPHFSIVNNTTNTVSMFCRDVSVLPRT